MRLGKLTTKIGLAMVLSKFNIELIDKELLKEDLKFNPKQGILTPIKTFDFKVTVR